MKASRLARHIVEIMAEHGDFELMLLAWGSDDALALDDSPETTGRFDADAKILYMPIRDLVPIPAPFEVVGAAVYDATTDQLEPVAELMTDAERYLTYEKGIWRVEFNKSFSQTPRINYVEVGESQSYGDVRTWQSENIPLGIHIVSCRPATVADAPELERLAGE